MLLSAGAIFAPMASAQQLEEVIVTAQKQSASTQDTPLAITGMTDSQLEKFGFANANDISAQVPNMQVSGPYGDIQPIFSIRGVSMSDYSSNQTSPIGVYADEAYMGAVYTHGMNFFDVARLEVLRGPQGTLYGKNTTGGAINIITKSPVVGDDTAFNIKLGAGNYGLTKGDLGVQGDIVDDKLAARLAYSFTRSDGTWENKSGGPDLNQTDFNAIRLTLNWMINDRWSFTPKITHGQNDALGNAIRNEPRGDLSNNTALTSTLSVLGVGVNNKENNGFIDNTGYSRPARGLGYWEIEDNFTGPLIVSNTNFVGKLEYVGDRYTFTSNAAFGVSDYSQLQNTDGSPEELLEIDWSVNTKSFSQDFRLSGPISDSIDVIAGAYYAIEDMDMHNKYYIYDTPPDLRVAGTYPGATGFYPYLLDFGYIDQKMDTEKTSYALYSQFRWNVTAKLGVDIGLRYTYDIIDLAYLNISRFSYDGDPRGTWTPGNTTGRDEPFIHLNVGGQSILEPGVLISDLLSGNLTLDDLLLTAQTGYTHGEYTTDSAPNYRAKEKEWTGKIGIDYAANENLMMYASYSRGYRSGNFNGGIYYEARDFENAYAAPEFLDAYEIGFKSDFYDKRGRLNAALFFYDYTDQQFINVVGVSNFLENAGGSQIAGAEAEFTFAISESVIFNLGLGVLETEYTELSLSNTETLNDPDDRVDLSGNELISAPKISANTSLDIDLLTTDLGILSLNVNANYQDSQWYSAYNDKNGYGSIGQDAYVLYNGRLTWSGIYTDYSVSVWGKNLMDERYDVFAINLQSGFGYDLFTQGAPRTFGVDVSYNF